jgi:hypothetical protein
VNLLVDPRAGDVLVKVVCHACGIRAVAVVQEHGDILTPRGEVLTGLAYRALSGKGKPRSADGRRGHTVSSRILNPAGHPELVAHCPRHGKVVADRAEVFAAAQDDAGSSPRVVSAVRPQVV